MWDWYGKVVAVCMTLALPVGALALWLLPGWAGVAVLVALSAGVVLPLVLAVLHLVLEIVAGLYDLARTPHTLVRMGLAQPHESQLSRWLSRFEND